MSEIQIFWIQKITNFQETWFDLVGFLHGFQRASGGGIFKKTKNKKNCRTQRFELNLLALNISKFFST